MMTATIERPIEVLRYPRKVRSRAGKEIVSKRLADLIHKMLVESMQWTQGARERLKHGMARNAHDVSCYCAQI